MGDVPGPSTMSRYDQMVRRHNEVNKLVRKEERDNIMAKKRNLSPTEFAGNDEQSHDCVNVEDLKMLIHNFNNADLSQKIKTLQNVRNQFCNNNPDSSIVEELVSAGVITVLVDALDKDENTHLQYESIWALAIIAEDKFAQQLVKESGAIQKVMELFQQSKDQQVCNLALWALGEILCQGGDTRDYVLSLNLVDRLSSFYNENLHISSLEKITWVIATICLKNPEDPSLDTVKAIVPMLSSLILHEYTGVATKAVSIMGSISLIGDNYTQILVESDVICRMVPLIISADVKLQWAVLTALYQIMCGSYQSIQLAVASNVLNYLSDMLDQNKEYLIEPAMKLVFFLMETDDNVSTALQNGIISYIIDRIKNGNISQYAAYIFENITFVATMENMVCLADQGLLNHICSLLAPDNNKEFTTGALRAISSMLSTPGIKWPKYIQDVTAESREKIIALTNHEDVSVVNLANGILQLLKI